MENVTAGQSRARLITELRGVADSAELVLSDPLEVTNGFRAVSVQAWQAVALTVYTFTSVTAFLVCLSAKLEFLIFLLLPFLCLFDASCPSCVDHYSFVGSHRLINVKHHSLFVYVFCLEIVNFFFERSKTRLSYISLQQA